MVQAFRGSRSLFSDCLPVTDKRDKNCYTLESPCLLTSFHAKGQPLCIFGSKIVLCPGHIDCESTFKAASRIEDDFALHLHIAGHVSRVNLLESELQQYTEKRDHEDMHTLANWTLNWLELTYDEGFADS